MTDIPILLPQVGQTVSGQAATVLHTTHRRRPVPRFVASSVSKNGPLVTGSPHSGQTFTSTPVRSYPQFQQLACSCWAIRSDGTPSYALRMASTSPTERFTTTARFDAVICDIDGCLSPEGHAPMAGELLVRIAEHNRLASSNRDRPIVTLCSGRPQPFVEAMCRLIHNDRLPCVAEMGVWLFDPTSNANIIDPAITPEHLSKIDEARRWAQSELGPRGVTIQPGKTASVSLYHEDTASLKSLMPMLETTFRVCNWPLRVSDTWLYVNCDLAFVSKKTGIDRLIERTGLDPTRLAGIGDTMSDAAIRESVAWFGCPANAADELKPLADRVAERREAEGVLELLEELSA